MTDTMTTFEIDYWVSEYPELELHEIIDILNAIEKDSQEENDWPYCSLTGALVDCVLYIVINYG